MIEPQTARYHQRKLNEIVRLASDDITTQGLQSTADPETFATVVHMLEDALSQMKTAAQTLNERDGFTWAEIAAALGVTRSAAYQRFAK